MECMGFSNDVTKWFESYLSQRMFSVHVEKSFCEKALINCGVPQGSILGPLLFLRTLMIWCRLQIVAFYFMLKVLYGH